MHIDKELISKLEDLAMLKLSEEEKEHVLQDLNKILKMIRKIEEADTEDVEPLIYLTNVQNRLRNDVPGEELDRERALKNAKSTNNQFFVVPKAFK